MNEQKELIIPAFSPESYQLARQRANDYHNNGSFALLVTARQYASVNEFLTKARITQPQVVERAPCQGIILDPVVGEKDFASSTLLVLQVIASAMTIPCFLVRYSHQTKYTTIIARNQAELQRLREVYWDTHGIGQSTIQVISPVVDIDETVSVELNKNSIVVLCGDVNVPFKYSWAGEFFDKYANVIVVF